MFLIRPALAKLCNETYCTPVYIESGATLMQPSSASLATFDAFASEEAAFASMSLSEGSGCNLGGMSLYYTFAAVQHAPAALTIHMELLSTTVIAETSIAIALKAVQLDDMIGTHSNAYVLSILCRHPATLYFPKACEFFNPSNLARVCFAFVSLLRSPEGLSYGPLSIDDPFVLSTSDIALLHSDLRFGLTAARGRPCRPDGINLNYVISDRASALEVDVTPLSAKVWANPLMTTVFTRLQLSDLIGTHTYTDFLSIVCREAGKQALPKACDFFSASHLGGVCDSMSTLHFERPDVRDIGYTLLDNALPLAEDPFMLRPAISTAHTATGTPLYLYQTARASPCTPTGLKLVYYHNGNTPALEVEVLAGVTTATASHEFTLVLIKYGLSDMIGRHTSTEFRTKMCREQGTSFFPYACNFLAPQHIGLLCSSLTQLLAESAQAWLKALE